MINTNYDRYFNYEPAFIDRSYPSEETTLAVDVFQLETLIDDYNSRREEEEGCEAGGFFYYMNPDEQEMLRELEAELRRKRERLAFIKQ